MLRLEFDWERILTLGVVDRDRCMFVECNGIFPRDQGTPFTSVSVWGKQRKVGNLHRQAERSTSLRYPGV